jgi:hypothetical protein
VTQNFTPKRNSNQIPEFKTPPNTLKSIKETAVPIIIIIQLQLLWELMLKKTTHTHTHQPIPDPTSSGRFWPNVVDM